MRSFPRTGVALLLGLLAMALSPAAASAKTTLVQYPISVDVSMKVTVDETFESIQKCTPGENGSVAYTYDFESDKAGTKGKVGNATLSLTNGEGGSGFSTGEAGGAVERGKAGPWELSLDDCNNATDISAPDGVSSPTCKTLKGKVEAAVLLTPAEDTEDGLTPLGGGDGKLVIRRKGGGGQNMGCVRLFQNTKPAADGPFDLGLGLSAIGGSKGASDTFTIKLPGLGASLAKITAKKTSRISYKFGAGGPCYAMTGTSKASKLLQDDASSAGNVGPVFGIPRFQTCSVKGDGVVVVTRRGAITKRSF